MQDVKINEIILKKLKNQLLQIPLQMDKMEDLKLKTLLTKTHQKTPKEKEDQITQLTKHWKHVLVAEALTIFGEVSLEFWHTLWVVLCSLIWKDSNNHVFGGRKI